MLQYTYRDMLQSQTDLSHWLAKCHEITDILSRHIVCSVRIQTILFL